MKMTRRIIAALAVALCAGPAVAASTCNVKEYSDVGVSLNNSTIQVALEPGVADQTPIDFSSGHAESLAFNVATRFIEVICNTQASYLIGATPVATNLNSWIPAGISKFMGIPKGKGYKISVVANP